MFETQNSGRGILPSPIFLRASARSCSRAHAYRDVASISVPRPTARLRMDPHSRLAHDEDLPEHARGQSPLERLAQISCGWRVQQFPLRRALVSVVAAAQLRLLTAGLGTDSRAEGEAQRSTQGGHEVALVTAAPGDLEVSRGVLVDHDFMVSPPFVPR